MLRFAAVTCFLVAIGVVTSHASGLPHGGTHLRRRTTLAPR
jgi:hypothetical protein